VQPGPIPDAPRPHPILVALQIRPTPRVGTPNPHDSSVGVDLVHEDADEGGGHSAAAEATATPVQVTALTPGIQTEARATRPPAPAVPSPAAKPLVAQSFTMDFSFFTSAGVTKAERPNSSNTGH